MSVKIRHIILLLSAVLPVSCNLTKFVPQDRYLLDRVNIVVQRDTGMTEKPTPHERIKNGEISASLGSYLRQKPNTKILGFWRLQLDIYNTAPLDTTTRARARLARNARKMGEAPEIYDPDATAGSIAQLEKAMQNMGYFNAMVDTSSTVKKRRLAMTYHVYSREPYMLKSYHTRLDREDVREWANDTHRQLIHAGEQFDTRTMDKERERIATSMRNQGYYYFDKGMLDFEADSSYRANEVALTLKDAEYMRQLPDSLADQIYTRMYISRVCFHTDYEPGMVSESQVPVVEKDGAYEFSYVERRLIRNRVLRRRCAIRPGMLYSAARVERTYELLNEMAPIKYVDISFEPVSRDSLECHITIARSKLNAVSAELEGTYSAGDWGIAAGVGYVNKNIFHGAEELSLGARFSHEWRQNGGRALEGKADLGLRWPTSFELKFAYDYQTRPDEYTRTIASTGLYYTLNRRRSKWRHVFNVVDLSYVWLPWISETYQKEIIDQSSVLRYSYENHFIMDWSYTGFYSSQRKSNPNRSYVNLRLMAETAGNALYGLSRLARLPQDENGQYIVFKVPFSQYAKGDVDFTFHHVIQPDHQLVYHVGVGVMCPYLNASAVPFEKRFFSGGSNSVRGWQARTLGPGTFSGASTGGVYRYDLQAGDIRLDLNLEYRWHVWNFLHLAAFTDAGNIWTIYDYNSQPGGCFRWNTFGKQIAWSYGMGVRLDFSVMVFRVDMGVKLYDPTRLSTDGRVWRTAPNGLKWRDDFTLHFAIGYPF